jgi:nicotinic acid phosphoribosyltransferase
MKISGTMGHEWIMSFPDVKTAFETWIKNEPRQLVGLVDTVRSLEVDFPAWLDALYAHRDFVKEHNAPFWAWRNDSGDLAVLTMEQYRRFFEHPLSKDPWFVERMRIVLTNDLDEHSASAIRAQIASQSPAAGLDAADILRRIVWGAGTRPGSCVDDPALGGVMKLFEVDGDPTMKLSLDAYGRFGAKTSLPGFNRSALVMNENGQFAMVLVYPDYRYEIRDGKLHDVVKGRTLDAIEGHHPDTPGNSIRIDGMYTIVPQQGLIYDSIEGDGFTGDWNNPTLPDVTATIRESMSRLPWSMTRMVSPEVVPVRVTEDLFDLRRHMIEGRRMRDHYRRF